MVIIIVILLALIVFLLIRDELLWTKVDFLEQNLKIQEDINSLQTQVLEDMLNILEKAGEIELKGDAVNETIGN